MNCNWRAFCRHFFAKRYLHLAAIEVDDDLGGFVFVLVVVEIADHGMRDFLAAWQTSLAGRLGGGGRLELLLRVAAAVRDARLCCLLRHLSCLWLVLLLVKHLDLRALGSLGLRLVAAPDFRAHQAYVKTVRLKQLLLPI